MTKTLKICPKCKKPVEAKDYMNPVIVAFLDSTLPTMNCSCGYTGLPVKINFEDYKKLIKGE